MEKRRIAPSFQRAGSRPLNRPRSTATRARASPNPKTPPSRALQLRWSCRSNLRAASSHLFWYQSPRLPVTHQHVWRKIRKLHGTPCLRDGLKGHLLTMVQHMVSNTLRTHKGLRDAATTAAANGHDPSKMVESQPLVLLYHHVWFRCATCCMVQHSPVPTVIGEMTYTIAAYMWTPNRESLTVPKAIRSTNRPTTIMRTCTHLRRSSTCTQHSAYVMWCFAERLSTASSPLCRLGARSSLSEGDDPP